MIFDRLSRAFSRLGPGRRRAEKAREELRANAEKALRMRQEKESGTHIPPHRTSHEGMQPHEATNRDHIPAREGSYTPELKRTKVARSGDAS